jgi:hypothetical protein
VVLASLHTVQWFEAHLLSLVRLLTGALIDHRSAVASQATHEGTWEAIELCKWCDLT